MTVAPSLKDTDKMPGPEANTTEEPWEAVGVPALAILAMEATMSNLMF